MYVRKSRISFGPWWVQSQGKNGLVPARGGENVSYVGHQGPKLKSAQAGREKTKEKC